MMQRLPPLSVILASLVLVTMLVLVIFAPMIAPMDPRDVSSYSLIDAEIPPVFVDGGDPRFLLGTDNQGRDLVSVILFGLRISVLIGVGAVLFAAAIGVLLGLIAGFFGFYGVEGLAAQIAKICFFIFVVLFVLALVAGRRVIEGPSV